MRYLLLVLLLTGCNVEVNTEEDDYIVKIEKKPDFKEVGFDNITHNYSSKYNGTIDELNSNSWVYSSHTNSLCTYSVDPVKSLKSPCRKVNTIFNDNVASDRITKISFDLTVVDFNTTDAPYWDIIFQDWVRIIPTDANGNHPISTLKLKVFDGKLYIAHYDNSWQWGYDHGSNVDSNSIDIDHTLHQENTLNAIEEVFKGVLYPIDIIIYDSGKFILSINNRVVSDVKYQTKSPTETHVIQWGQYWSKGYNYNNEADKQIIINIENIKRFTATE